MKKSKADTKRYKLPLPDPLAYVPPFVSQKPDPDGRIDDCTWASGRHSRRACRRDGLTRARHSDSDTDMTGQRLRRSRGLRPGP